MIQHLQLHEKHLQLPAHKFTVAFLPPNLEYAFSGE